MEYCNPPVWFLQKRAEQISFANELDRVALIHGFDKKLIFIVLNNLSFRKVKFGVSIFEQMRSKLLYSKEWTYLWNRDNLRNEFY